MGNLFNNKDIKLARQHMGEEAAGRWEGLEKKQENADVITIANTGLYSSGKSSLFNALLDQIDNARFPVGAIPTTKSGDREKLSRYVEIIDTPGIDATYEDDHVAVSMLMESDIILITHNIKTGMLNQSEYTWIQNIVKNVGKNELAKRLVFICTWIDEVTDEADRKKVTNELKRQLNEILNVEIPFWEVSAKRYCVARKKESEKLIRTSNIPQFRVWLLDKAEEYRNTANKNRKQEVLDLCIVSRDILMKKKLACDMEYEKIKKEIERQFVPKQRSWDMILENFKEMKKTVQNKLRSLKKEEYDRYVFFEQQIKSM